MNVGPFYDRLFADDEMLKLSYPPPPSSRYTNYRFFSKGNDSWLDKHANVILVLVVGLSF